MKNIFARHGIPSVVVSDNATCYSSRLYREFVEEYHCFSQDLFTSLCTEKWIISNIIGYHLLFKMLM